MLYCVDSLVQNSRDNISSPNHLNLIDVIGCYERGFITAKQHIIPARFSCYCFVFPLLLLWMFCVLALGSGQFYNQLFITRALDKTADIPFLKADNSQPQCKYNFNFQKVFKANNPI